MDITASTKEAPERLEIFFCYAHEDQPLLQELIKHLMPLKREGLITLWADTDINAGAEWEKEIHLHLNTSHIILLLVSPDFVASDYCYSIEMRQAVERHNQGDAQVIPIIVRPTDWQNAPFSKLQALPKNAVPVRSSVWHTQDDAFLNTVEGIRRVINRLITNERRFQVKAVESALRVEETRHQKSAGKEKFRQIPEQIGAIRLISCVFVMSTGVFIGIPLFTTGGALIVIPALLGGLSFLIRGQNAKINTIKGSTLIFAGNVLLISGLSYPSPIIVNGDLPLPPWLMCTSFNNYSCTSINYSFLGVFSILLCVAMIFLGGWFLCQQANASIRVIIGSVIITMNVGAIALTSPDVIAFHSQATSIHLSAPFDLSIPIYLVGIIVGITVIFITWRNKATNHMLT